MKKLVLNLILCLSLTNFANAQWYHTAESLFLSARYDEALIYYLRANYEAEKLSPNDDLALRIIQCHNRTGDYNKAYQMASAQPYRQLPDSVHPAYRFEAALAAYELGNYKDANFQFVQLRFIQPDSALHPIALQLKIMTAIQLQDTSIAIDLILLQAARCNFTDTERVHNLLDEIKQTKYLNPNTANWLAVILPGSGLIYAGNIKEGLTSAGLQISCLALTAFAVYNQLYFTGYAYGLTALQQFYFGGIRRTATIVRQENYKRKSLLINNLIFFSSEMKF